MQDSIDVVIPWVDGDDPALKKKRRSFMHGNIDTREDIAAPTRFRSVGEIAYCVASILRFAPYVRKIFIVTDGQNPHLDSFLDYYFPNRTTPVEIVDHTVIFRGYEEHLPVFNSIAISTMLWRIPDLSEKFLLFNDDLLLVSPTTPETFFRGDSMVISGYPHYTLTAWLARTAISLFRHPAPIKFRDNMLNAALLIGGKAYWKFVRIIHSPHPMRKSILKKLFDEHPQALTANIAHRFRHRTQFGTGSAHATIAMHTGRAIFDNDPKKYTYFQPSDIYDGKFERLMTHLDSGYPIISLCINSFDEATPEAQQRLKDWLDSRLGVNIDRYLHELQFAEFSLNINTPQKKTQKKQKTAPEYLEIS